MAQQTILGGSGVTWGAEKIKINANFSELYSSVALKDNASPTALAMTSSSAVTESQLLENKFFTNYGASDAPQEVNRFLSSVIFMSEFDSTTPVGNAAMLMGF